jgi:hypothetical protein
VPALKNIAIPVAFIADSVSLPSCNHKDIVNDTGCYKIFMKSFFINYILICFTQTKWLIPFNTLLYCKLQSSITIDWSDTVQPGGQIHSGGTCCFPLQVICLQDYTVSQPTRPQSE